MSASHEVESSFSESPQLCRKFTFSEIQLATQNLDESLVIGRGGFGKVYKGTITNGANLLTAAIKRLDSNSNQGASEFWAEVNMLSNLRHCHLVSLIGYCNEGQEMILVYEYMSCGSLEDHLHKSQSSDLSWVQRLTICIGAARGLDYLHTGTGIEHGVIHRDVKSSNILLHNSWAAKISDFGLSKICPRNQQTTYINTGIKGTFGYLDLNYFYTGKLTRKSDVYAFGVVLFEVLCGKRAIDSSIDEEQWALAIWAQDSIKEGRLKEIVDTNIRAGISRKSLKAFAKLAKCCLHMNPKQRPTMAEVVVGLESILALQEKANSTLQPNGKQTFAKKALMASFPSGGSSLSPLELYFDTIAGENRTLERFDLDTLIVATENFSEAIKTSSWTFDDFDLLYKGKLQNGQSIVVARYVLSGITDDNYYMNEASILAKLEHENVAKLLGYCIKGNKLFLVYDFALHTSLDCLIYDMKWDKRYKIILGVARALLYLHKHAPIRIIHGAVKPANILLDESFNPKLADFQNAEAINETDRIEVNKNFWTRDYMAPEYKKNGVLSTKADVYSFGVLVLETMIGRRVHFLKSINNWSLFKHVARNWLEGTLSNIIDPRIDVVDTSFLTRFLEIGLLCVQREAGDRPTMEEVVSMLLDSSSLTLSVSKMQEMVTSADFDSDDIGD